MNTNLKSEERLDDLQVNGYEIIQHPGKFCFGMDAVLLANFARVKKQERALDLGTGTGIIPILLTAKTEGQSFVGLEIQEESADMARRSVVHNHLEEKVEIVTGDIKEAAEIFGPVSFDVITVNPPYMIGQHGIANASDTKVLKPKGRFYMVHRPFRLAEILSKMVAAGIEPKRMRMVHPFIDKEPNMVLIEGARGGNSRMTIEPPLIVYKEVGVYNDELLAEYGMK